MSSLTATVSRPRQLGAHDKDHTPASQPTLTHWSSGMVPPAGYLSWLHSPAGDGHREHSACTACGSLCAEALRGASPAWRLTCTAPGPRLMAFPVPTVPSLAHFVTIQPTLKGPARPSIMPFLRTKLAFPKFPQHSVWPSKPSQTKPICGCSHPQGPYTRCPRRLVKLLYAHGVSCMTVHHYS